MKKLLTLAAIALFGFSATFAQTTTTVKQAPKKVTTTTKTEAKKVEKKATSTATKLKADGTPDMRYAENKAAKVNPAGPKKKDGTADMRYKANQAAAKKKN
ncbi:hypothetical protein [Pedobacter xixiisoli]|uniref:Colicin import membrane protein n=1 Tax=Pedobacter xixiisoli TaxID=1476464 RepID=A0A286AD42_9SPHI|nr:hypothetical protein [Pedobacter xixiisoli]SOD19824.1 hypothetical protein SAMN06297358_3530 [Pedobacter xixiisoli]